MSRNKTADARKALNRIAKMNKSRVPVDEMVDELLLDEANVNEKNKGLFSLIFKVMQRVLHIVDKILLTTSFPSFRRSHVCLRAGD